MNTLMKIFSLIGKVIGKFGIILMAIFAQFDFEDLLSEGDLLGWVRSEFKKLADLFKKRFGRGKIKVNKENATKFIECVVLTLEKFGSLDAFHAFIVQVPKKPETDEDKDVDDMLKDISL